MGNIKIIVLCGGRFAFPAIQLLGMEKYLAGIAIGDGEKTALALLRQETQKLNIPFKEIKKNDKAALEDWIKTIQPDAVFCICYPFRISESLLNYLPERFINFHTGPLPQYRGPMPIFEVLRSLEKETALTVLLMNAAFDEGPIIFGEPIPIEEGETFGSLSTKLSDSAAMAALNMAQMLDYGTTVPLQEQNPHEADYHPVPESRDTYIDWDSMHAKEIESLVNACNPWNLGADTVIERRAFKILVAKCLDIDHNASPGTILGMDKRGNIHIACIENQVLSIEIIMGDKGICKAQEFDLFAKYLQEKSLIEH